MEKENKLTVGLLWFISIVMVLCFININNIGNQVTKPVKTLPPLEIIEE